MRAGFQSIQDNADAVIDKTHRSKIGMRQATLLAAAHHFSMGWRGGVIVNTQKIFWQIIQITFRVLWQHNLVLVVEIKPFGWHQERDVWAKETDRHEEWFIEILLEHLGRVLG